MFIKKNGYRVSVDRFGEFLPVLNDFLSDTNLWTCWNCNFPSIFNHCYYFQKKKSSVPSNYCQQIIVKIKQYSANPNLKVIKIMAALQIKWWQPNIKKVCFNLSIHGVKCHCKVILATWRYNLVQHFKPCLLT